MMVIAFICGIIYIASLVFIPIGIYCLSGAFVYSKVAKANDGEIIYYKKSLEGWAVFMSIACFPFGLISLIVYNVATSNDVKINNIYENTDDKHEYDSAKIKRDSFASNQTSSSESEQVVVSEDAMNKFLEIKAYHDQGLITDAEFEKAKNQIFGSK